MKLYIIIIWVRAAQFWNYASTYFAQDMGLNLLLNFVVTVSFGNGF